MKVSFIIPTRNQAPYLRRCLDSCLAQGLPDAEVLVVDGLSTDGSQAILASYGERIAWTSQADSGQAQAVNRGVARARGDIIAWINSDDCYHGPEVLRTVVAAFQDDPRLEIVYGDAIIVDELGSPLRSYRNRAFARPGELLVSPIGPAQPAAFFRRELFQRVGGLREELHWALDYDLFLRLFSEARATRYLPQTLARTTFHAGAKSIRGMLPQIREVVRLKREHGARLDLGPLERARLWWGVGGLYLYWAAVKLGLRRAG